MSTRIAERLMNQSVVCIVATVLALVAPCVAGAQICEARPGPDNGRIQLGLGRASTEGVNERTTYIGGVGSTLFGNTTGVIFDYDNSGRTDYAQTATVGYRRQIGTSGNTELCPLVGGSIGEVQTLIRTAPFSVRQQRIARTRSANVGVSLGHRIPVNAALTAIPAVRVNFVRSTFDNEVSNVNVSNNYGAVTMSAGLVLVTHFTFSPEVSFPIGLEGASTRWGLAFTASFWRKKP